MQVCALLPASQRAVLGGPGSAVSLQPSAVQEVLLREGCPGRGTQQTAAPEGEVQNRFYFRRE